MLKVFFVNIFFQILCGGEIGHSGELTTNAARLKNAPVWLRTPRVERIIDRIQAKLEWSVRRIEVQFISDATSYQKSHGLKANVRAVTLKKGEFGSIVLGPAVNQSNFDEVFAHELVHIIFYQKYKDAIPRWLEEGFASFLARQARVNYKTLSANWRPLKVSDLAHPLSGSAAEIQYKYQVATALVEMLAKKCDLDNLLRLSVERKLENYIKTYCEILDLDQALKSWVMARAQKA